MTQSIVENLGAYPNSMYLATKQQKRVKARLAVPLPVPLAGSMTSTLSCPCYALGEGRDFAVSKGFSQCYSPVDPPQFPLLLTPAIDSVLMLLTQKNSDGT